MADFDRLLEWLLALAAARSTQHRHLSGGEVFINEDLPDAHDHNFAWLHEPEAVTKVEAFFTEHGVGHRLLECRAEIASELADALPGHERSTELFMKWAGGDPPASRLPIEELTLTERCAVAEAGWRGVVPNDEARQLGDRARTLQEACAATFLGVRDVTGRVVSRLDVYSADGITQLEELITDPAHQRQGMGTALLNEALRRAASDNVFLIAEDNSGPAAMYRRLGFRDAGRKASFTRPAPSRS